MRIAEFIREDIEPILKAWGEFVHSLSAARHTDKAGLREHARKMLLSIASHLEQPQNQTGRLGTARLDQADAQQGPSKAKTGFNINENISVLRGLRASVTNLWIKSIGTIGEREYEEISRFQEAIDQAITESLTHYSAEKELHTQLLDTVMLASPDPIYVLDTDGRFMFANKATERIFELSGQEVIGQNAFEMSHPFVADVKSYSQQVLETKNFTRGDLAPLYSARHRQIFECLLYPVLDQEENVKAIIYIWNDITERKIEEENIWHDANYDGLTDLPNRQLLLDRLQQEVNNASRSTLPLAVLFVALDGFKDVSDSLGQESGDCLLCSVADRLNFCVRKNDIVARYGGDKFTVVLTNLQEGMDVSAFAHKIVDILGEPFHVKENNVLISCSIGIALYHQDADTPDDLLKRADQAVYAAKEAGRNQVCFLGPNSVVKTGLGTTQVEH